MAWGFIGNTLARATASTTAITPAVNTTGADFAAMVICTFGLNASTTTPSDSQSNTWTKRSNYVTGNFNICIAYANLTSTSATHTFSCNPNGTGYPCIFLLWFSGRHATPFDVDNGNTVGSGTSVQCGSVTPNQPNSLIVCGFSDNFIATSSIDSGFTKVDSNANNSFECGADAYLIQGAASAVNPTWSSLGSGAHAAAIAVFKPAVTTGNLFLPSTLAGLGSGGPFFQNPLG